MSYPRDIMSGLRKRGYKRKYLVRGRDSLVCYTKDFPGAREVEVQLWVDGNFRASHSIKGCSKTKPTDFKTFGGMLVALAIEETRTDGFQLSELSHEPATGDLNPTSPNYVGHLAARLRGVQCLCKLGTLNINCAWHGR